MKFLFILLASISLPPQSITSIHDVECYLPQSFLNGDTDVTSFTFSDVFEKPDSTSNKIGKLGAYGHSRAFSLQLRNLNDSILHTYHNGDWIHGKHLTVINRQGNFVEIQEGIENKSAWIQVRNKHLFINRFIHQIIHLETTIAQTYSNEKTQIGSGNYIVEKIENGFITVREEVPSDMPCEVASGKVDVTSLPKYKININQLLNEEGKLILPIAYPRGC